MTAGLQRLDRVADARCRIQAQSHAAQLRAFIRTGPGGRAAGATVCECGQRLVCTRCVLAEYEGDL